MLMHPSLPDPEHTLLNRFKTNKEKIIIEKDPKGNPKIPILSVSDTYNIRALQTMLWEYCTAHIRRSQDTSRAHLFTHGIQNTSLARIAFPFHGRRCAADRRIGSWKNAIPKASPGQIHPKFKRQRCSDFWSTGDSVRRTD